MTGIQGGSFGPGRAVLKVGALTKIFDGDGSALRLVQVSDGFNNWIRLEYADTGVSRIVSSAGRYVSVTRDGSGRVIGAEDDSGRATHYGYDSDGALAESVDVGGGESRYRYSEGRFLAEVIDPRGVESLSARFDAEGKAVTVHSQHDTAAYEYESNSTTIRNALQQAAVFTFHPSGLVESVQDFAGGLTALDFDADLHVEGLRFNGAVLFRARYQDGRLSAFVRNDTDEPRERHFYYDSSGHLERITEGTRVVSRYRYDDHGKVIYGEDYTTTHSRGYGGHGQVSHEHEQEEEGDVRTVRRYAYDARGNLRRVSLDGTNFLFDVNGAGMVNRVTWGENRKMDIAYTDTDRVRRLAYNVDDSQFGAQFEYDAGGFRVLGRYEVLAALSSDAVLFGL